jgi:hypothetical protein
MMYYRWLTRTEVLMMVYRDDVLLMVDQNWGIDDANGDGVLLMDNRDDVLMMVNHNWGIVDG